MKPRIVIVVEGGLVQEILADQKVDVSVIDFDTEGAPDEDLTVVPSWSGQTAAFACNRHVGFAPKRVEKFFAAIERDERPKRED